MKARKIATHEDFVVREVIGIFSTTDDLQRAIDELLAYGLDRNALGLLAAENTVKTQLKDIYIPADKLAEMMDGPRTAFVEKDSVGDTTHALLGQLYFIGTSTVAGAVVISAGVLGGAALAAAAGIAAVGAVGAAVGKVIQQSEAEYLQEHVDAGHLLLFVRVKDPAEEKKVKETLSKYCNFDIEDIKVLNVTTGPVTV